MTLSINNQSAYQKQTFTTTMLSEQLLLTVLKMDMVRTFKSLCVGNDNIADYRFSDQTLLIHQAAKYNAVNCLDHLLKLGADIDQLSYSGKRPLEYALEAQADKTAPLLQETGAKAYDLSLIDLIKREKNSSIRESSLAIADIMMDIDIICDNLTQYLQLLLTYKLKQQDDSLLALSMKAVMMTNHDRLIKIRDFNGFEDRDLALIKRFVPLATLNKVIARFNRLKNEYDQYAILVDKLAQHDHIKTISWELLERYNQLVTELN